MSLHLIVTPLISELLQFTHDARRVAIAGRHGVALVGTRGERRVIADEGARALAVFGDQVWTCGDAGLERWSHDGRALGAALELSGPGTLAPALAGGPAAIWLAEAPRIWIDDLGTFRELVVPADTACMFAGRRLVAAGLGEIRLGAVRWPLPQGAKLAAAAAMFDGAGILLVVRRGPAVEAWTSTAAGVVQHRIALPAGRLRLAARRGILVVDAEQGHGVAIDLRFGRVLGDVELGSAVDDLAIDRDGRLLALRSGEDVSIVPVHDALLASRPRSIDETDEPAQVAREMASTPVAAAPVVTASAPVVAAPVQRKLVRPLALAALAPRVRRTPVPRAEATAHLDRELALVARWAFMAIAAAWNTRRLGYANESAHPHEHEVAAILGFNDGFAPEHLEAAIADAEAHGLALHADPSRRGPATPLGMIASELGLSPIALDILLVAAAPTLAGDIARLYGILANDPGRPMVDEHLVAAVLSPYSAHDIARELDARAPLVSSGAIQLAHERARPFAALVVDPVILARLRGEPPDLGGAVALRQATTALEQLELAPHVVPAAVEALARAGDGPTRIALRGRPSTGRRSLLAALVAEAGRELGTIDASWLPRGPDAFASALRVALRRVHLAGVIPCVTGLDAVSFGERTLGDVVGEVLRGHPGPLAVILAPEVPVPFDPGHVAIEVPVLDETARLGLWQRALATTGRWVRDVAGLAARYRIGPGMIHRALAALPPGDDDATEAIEGFIRQTRDARLATIARRVERTVTWSNLVLPPDIVDSLRELIGRVRHRRQVYETWGMGEALATSRGITALFQGQPGTGKTLVAGVIARELGLDLYQVDLSKVMSKWIGETERNLATIFDAAEDGQVILLFDEADSLFAKRTEVRSSNDRYANLEVNYLLQRLDVFEGIAILTTNFGGSIDPAFKRRMSFRLSFPFPDEDTRQQLWRVHLPPQLPIGGELALDKLARKYQLAGGYIRNACLRAAFLAAQEETTLDQRHLERAVTLEFAELGKLSSSGTLE